MTVAREALLGERMIPLLYSSRVSEERCGINNGKLLEHWLVPVQKSVHQFFNHSHGASPCSYS